MFLHCCCCAPADGSARAQGFEAAAIAAVALGSVAQDGHVSEFAGISVATAVDFAVDDDAPANAGADRVVDDVAIVFARAKSVFSKCAHVGIVVDYCGYAEVFFDNFRQWAIVPSGDVGGVDDALCIEVDGATKSNAAGQYG